MRLLGEHFAVGRLDVGEYDERCRQVATARFRSELEALFDDLPAPRPERAPEPQAAVVPRPAAVKIALAVGVAALAVLLLIVARQAALVLLIPLVAVLWFTWRR
ncbi:DUF1707 domain-containing protein [Saccharopolyspora hirsuta]|uniref:DUF1707 domain-containing protein n=2 Tax=Saccharopolyspora hirsuta TaxID=1837 RepID=A0A5M7BWD8_SACHI|nr:DUF1707 domain-containing protein [Saccharopolyspora hirsuta]